MTVTASRRGLCAPARRGGSGPRGQLLGARRLSDEPVPGLLGLAELQCVRHAALVLSGIHLSDSESDALAGGRQGDIAMREGAASPDGYRRAGSYPRTPKRTPSAITMRTATGLTSPKCLPPPAKPAASTNDTTPRTVHSTEAAVTVPGLATGGISGAPPDPPPGDASRFGWRRDCQAAGCRSGTALPGGANALANGTLAVQSIRLRCGSRVPPRRRHRGRSHLIRPRNGPAAAGGGSTASRPDVDLHLRMGTTYLRSAGSPPDCDRLLHDASYPAASRSRYEPRR